MSANFSYPDSRPGHELAAALARIPGRNEAERREVMARLLDVWRHLHSPGAGKSLRQLAAISGYSPWHLQRLFKHVFGVAPHALALQRRLAFAAELLRSTDEPVPAVSHRAGFTNRCAFSRRFKRAFGLSPSDYRASRAATFAAPPALRQRRGVSRQDLQSEVDHA